MSSQPVAPVIPNGTDHRVGAAAVTPNGGEENIIVPASQNPIAPTAFLPRRLRVVCVGAGISGIQLAHDVTTHMKNYELAIYEKNPELGGTWWENHYPGVACDVPAHTYQYSWEPNPRWSKFYAPGSEILQYLKDVANKHDLQKFLHFNHRVIGATWREESSQWQLEIEARGENGETRRFGDSCDFLVYGVGVLNNWKWPDIEGLQSFKGELMHTAAWNEGVDLKGKKVAVIGNGASAVQCVAALQPVVGKLYNYMRTATWMVPHFFSDGEVQQEYPAEVIEDFVSDHKKYFEYRLKLEKLMASGFDGIWNGSPKREILRQATLAHMKDLVKDERILSILIPRFEIGCRRFTPGDHYLRALQNDNVEVVIDPIEKLCDKGVVLANGSVHQVDAIICATGFNTSFAPRFPIIGRNGFSLSENWGNEDITESYMGALVAGLPNFAAFAPPNCPVIGSAFPGIESTSSYMIRLLDRLQHDNLRSFCVRQDAQTEFNAWLQSNMKKMVFSADCKSWWKSKSGKVIVPWPGTFLHFIKATSFVRWEDFDLSFLNPEQKYTSLGNGATEEGFAPDYPPWVKETW